MTHTEDLIFRLRSMSSRGISSWGDLQQEAADELEALINAVDAEREARIILRQALEQPVHKHDAAIKTLEHLKYTYHGGEYWKPPLGKVKALAQPEERNFCPRCGKRTADLTTIHTCTPPQGNT